VLELRLVVAETVGRWVRY